MMRMTSDSQSEGGGVVSSTALLGARYQISKRIPARTITVKALWVKKDFMEMSDRYREIRGRLRKPMDTCHLCRHKFENGEMMALSHLVPGGNKVLCQTCAGELERGECA